MVALVRSVFGSDGTPFVLTRPCVNRVKRVMPRFRCLLLAVLAPCDLLFARVLVVGACRRCLS